MALLKDTVISGSLRATDTIYTNKIQTSIIGAPTSSNGATFGVGTNGQVLKSNGAGVYWSSDSGVTSVRVQATSPITSSTNTAQTGSLDTTIALANNYGDTKNPYASKTKNTVLAAPATADGVPGFRALVADDIPTISAAKASLGNVSNNANLNSTTGARGDIIYWSAANTPAHLTNTSSTTKQFLSITSQVPSWSAVSKGDVGLGNVENTALSTWTGTNKITTVGTIGTGTWQGTAIDATYVGNLPASKINSGTFDAARIPTGISITGTANNVTGTVALDHGGTGATSASGARDNLGLGNAKIFYGTCATAAGTTEKEVTCAEFTSADLVAGAAILVTFSTTNSGAVGSLKLDVNSTGAKALKKQYNASAPSNLNSAGELQAGNTYLFIYNATYSSNAGAWVLMTADYNNTYSYDWTTGAAGASRTAETSANGGVGIHRYTLQMMTPNLTWSSLASDYPTAATTNGAATNKTVATCNFLLGSPILYQDTNANAAPGKGANVNGFTTGSLNLQYSTTNAQWTALTIQKPVYLVGVPQVDGSTFKLDSTKWWTQTLPTSSDGKIYIFLGMAYSATNIYLHDVHPIYWYIDGAFRLYETISPVARGGTGATSFTANSVIMSGSTTTAALTTRAITDNTTATSVAASTNLITANTLYYHKGNSNITTVGTITSGTWKGSVISSTYLGLYPLTNSEIDSIFA